MLIIIITLIAALSNLYADILSIVPPDQFIEIDPVVVNQPVKRILVSKNSHSSGISITINEQFLTESFEKYIAKTSEYVESTLNVLMKPIGEGKNKKGIQFKFYSVIQKKIEYDLEIIQAYFLSKDKLYLLSYNAPKALFSNNLTIFHNLLESVEFTKEFLNQTLEKEIFGLIEKEKISFEKFIQSKSILHLCRQHYKNLSNDHLISRLFELRQYFYE